MLFYCFFFFFFFLENWRVEIQAKMAKAFNQICHHPLLLTLAAETDYEVIYVHLASDSSLLLED